MSFFPQPWISEKRTAFLSQCGDDSTREFCLAIWRRKRAKASLIVEGYDPFNGQNEQTIYGESLELTPEEELDIHEEVWAAEDAAATKAFASTKEPYGDVHYCDDNMRGDGKKRFPCNTGARTKAAWSYSHHKAIMANYTSEQLSQLHNCIAAAYKKFFGEDPPSSKDS